MRKLLLLSLMAFAVLPVHAGTMDRCVKKFVDNADLWQNRLFDQTDGIFKDVPDTEKMTNDMVQSRKQQVYGLLAANTLISCNGDIGSIAEQGGRSEIDFTHDNTTYTFDFDTKTMLDYLNMRVGIVILNDRSKKPGDVILKSELPKDYWWNKDCSDHIIWYNTDDDAAINLAGQAVFGEFGGSKNEFIIDFPVGKSCRAFPGLILMEEGATTKHIVSYKNVRSGYEKTQAFVKRLQNTQCANGGLAAYLVALDVKQDTSASMDGWLIAAGVGGGTVAWFGLATAFSATSASLALAAKTGVIATSISSALSLSAGAVVNVPVAGWIAAAALVTAATAIALYPYEIEDLQQVMVLGGPYNI